MNDFAAIQRDPNDAEVLKVFRQPHIGEWVGASQLCREVLCSGLLGAIDLAGVQKVISKIESLTARGLLASCELKSQPGCRTEWVKLDGQMVNPADPIAMAPFMWHPIAKGLAKGYKITKRGQAAIGNGRRVRPFVVSTMLVTMTACSSLKTGTPIPQREPSDHQFFDSRRQVYQDRDKTGQVFWSYCINDCPAVTPKFPVRQIVQNAGHVQPEAKIIRPEVKIAQEETVKFSVFFKLNSTSIGQDDRNKVKEILGGQYRIKSINVTGRADPIGVSAHNQRLAQKRAQAMEELLESVGAQPDAIVKDARVEQSNLEADVKKMGSEPRTLGQKSRRVDVVVVRMKH